MQTDFLREILGEEGFKAINNSIERLPLLKSVLLPRAVVSWVSTVGKFNYEGQIPGLESSYISLKKNQDNTYTGALTVNDELYTFNNESLLHVAASVGVALNLETEAIDEKLKKRDLTRLGNGIDILVKSQIVKNNNKSNKSVSIPKLRLFSHELNKTCKVCGDGFFKNEEFTGCRCLSDLRKYLKLEKTEKDIFLKFNGKLDEDAIRTVVTALKR